MSLHNWQTNMIFRTPRLGTQDIEALGLVADLREEVRLYTLHNPKRWEGSLRRAMFAKAIQGSNSIEGINADIDTAVAAIEKEEPPLDERTETWAAINGYRAAMTYIMQSAQDRFFEFSKQFLKSLQFMIAGYTMDNNPGQWRPGAVFVVDSKTGNTVYTPPPVEEVDPLVSELVEYLRSESNEPALVRAAMGHLNLTMIHPFKDGNGRVARALQTLVIARDGMLHPVFSSIEEWLGDNTSEYYAVLAEVGQGEWNPHRDATPWIRFCIKGHYQQVAKIVRRNDEASALYEGIMGFIEHYRLPDRSWMALFDAALGLRITNPRYRNDADITDYTASRDLRRLSEAGLLDAKGEKRNRVYVAAKPITDLRNSIRIRMQLEDPYEILIQKKRYKAHLHEPPRLPGI